MDVDRAWYFVVEVESFIYLFWIGIDELNYYYWTGIKKFRDKLKISLWDYGREDIS